MAKNREVYSLKNYIVDDRLGFAYTSGYNDATWSNKEHFLLYKSDLAFVLKQKILKF